MIKPRLRARGGALARHDAPRPTERGAKPERGAKRKRGVFQLRLQARGNTARGGLAGPSRACKGGFGLALPRAGGERHYARGNGSSSPRGGLRPGAIRRLDRDHPSLPRERERERERCISSAEASTYGPVRPRSNPRHVCVHRTHAKTAPSPKRFRSLSQENPC